MKKAGWVPLDKNLLYSLPKDGRPYSLVEAMFSYSVDQNCGRDWSINGYANLWGWSRGKVRRFINSIRTGSGHVADRKRTGSGHPVFFIDACSQSKKDTSRTGSGQEADREQDTTIKNKNKNKNNKGFNAIAFRPEWFPEKDWKDVIEHKRKKKASLAKRALSTFISEIEKATALGFTIPQCVDEITNRNWTGFKAEWMDKSETPKAREESRWQ